MLAALGRVYYGFFRLQGVPGSAAYGMGRAGLYAKITIGAKILFNLFFRFQVKGIIGKKSAQTDTGPVGMVQKQPILSDGPQACQAGDFFMGIAARVGSTALIDTL